MARSLVDTSNNVTGMVRVLNPLNQEVTIYQDTVMGFAEPMESKIDIVCVLKTDEKESFWDEPCGLSALGNKFRDGSEDVQRGTKAKLLYCV